MKLEDIIALAKQGYKPSDIRELIELANTQGQEETPAGEQGEDAHSEDAESEHATDGDKPTGENAGANDNAVDYKALYEESQRQLQLAQKANTRKDMSDSADSESDEDLLNELARSFM